MKTCDSLEHLHMQSNLLSNFTTVENLKDLKNLTHLYLWEFNGDGKNPVCNEEDYRDQVFDLLVNLRSLDGTRRNCKFMEFKSVGYDDMDQPDYNSWEIWYSTDVKHDNPSWMEDFIDRDGEDELKSLIKECKQDLNTKKTLNDL